MIFTVYSSLFETALALFYSYQLMQDQLGSYVLSLKIQKNIFTMFQALFSAHLQVKITRCFR